MEEYAYSFWFKENGNKTIADRLTFERIWKNSFAVAGERKYVTP